MDQILNNILLTWNAIQHLDFENDKVKLQNWL